MRHLIWIFLAAVLFAPSLGAEPRQHAMALDISWIRMAAAPADDDKDLVAKGKDLFLKTYKCSDCHGMEGEGTDDGPDLVGTLLSAEEISKFLQKPSADATTRGMPSFAADSPDLKPLVAFVVSIKKTPDK